MFNPLVSLLPKSARRALPIITGGVARGLSSRAITQSILDAGIKISRGRSVLPAMRIIKKLESQGKNVQFVANRNVINTRRLPPAITQTKSKYTYRVRVNGINALGNPDVRYQYVSTDSDRMTPEMVQDEARQAMESGNKYRELTNETYTLEHGMQRAGIADFNKTSRGDFQLNR